MAGSTQIKTDGLAAINLSRGSWEPKMQYAIPKQKQIFRKISGTLNFEAIFNVHFFAFSIATMKQKKKRKKTGSLLVRTILVV